MSYLLPAQDEPTRRVRRKRIIAVLGSVIVAALLWSPVVHGFKKIRARKWIAEAEAYAAQNRGDLALQQATKAFQSGARDPRELRLLLELHGNAGSAEAFTLWAMLARHHAATVPDRRQLLRWAVAWRQNEAAESQWLLLKNEKPLPVESVRLGAAYYELRGNPGTAVEYAQQALAIQPEDLETRILLGRILMANGSPSDQSIGKRLLLEQAERQDQLGLSVLRFLAASDLLLPFEANECLIRLRSHPLKLPSDELAAADLENKVTPYRKESIVEETGRGYAQNGGDLIILGRWLLNRGNYPLVLELLPIKKAQERKELALLHMDALAALRRWNRIEELLSSDANWMEPFERSLYRARAATERNQDRLADLHWKQAFEHSAGEPTQLLTLATYAKNAGRIEAAIEALSSLAAKKPFSRKAHEELLRIQSDQGNLEGMREILEKMRIEAPHDPALKNDYAYLSLLQQREIENSIAIAKFLVKEHPSLLSFRITLALGYLRTERPGEAMAILEESPADWRQASASQQAIYAATLGNSGKSAKAVEMCKFIDWQQLKPEERMLIAAWRK